MLRAEVLLDRGRTQDAVKALEELSASPPSPELQAHLWMDIADTKRRLDDPAEARPLLEQARDLAMKNNITSLLPRIELKLGSILPGSDANVMMTRALNDARALDDPYWTAHALINSGYIRLVHNRYDEAIPWLEQAESGAQRIGAKAVVARAQGNLGWCYFRLGDFDRALTLLTSAESISGQLGLLDDQQDWLGNIGSIYFVRRDFDQAISYYRRALKMATDTANRGAVTRWLHDCAWASINKGDMDAAEKFSQEALRNQQNISDPAMGLYTKLGLAAIARQRGNLAEAERGYQELLKRSASEANITWEAHWGLAVLYQTHDRPDEAETEYRNALSVIDRQWLALTGDQYKMTYLEQLSELYHDCIQFLSGRGEKDAALEISESSRARLLSQKLDGLSAELPRFQSAEAVRLAAATGNVLLSYWLAPEKSYLWVINGKGTTQFSLPPQDQIEALVDRHNRAISNLQNPVESAGGAATALYDTLIRPAAALLPAGSRVILVPDGRLHDLNFETLVVSGASPHYWIHDATVSVAPSLGVLKLKSDAGARPPKLLLIGDPLASDKDYPPLAHVKRETELVAARFPAAGRALFTQGEAYPQKYREAQPQNFTAIHFAAHATANRESPLNSAVILSMHGDQHKLYARDVLDRPLRADLVTISACRSAGSRTYAGEGLIGFTWAFLQAGAGRVVAGLWDVDDTATPMLMDHFYEQLVSGASPATALRAAKLTLADSHDAFRKPYYWAAFEVFTRYATRR